MVPKFLKILILLPTLIECEGSKTKVDESDKPISKTQSICLKTVLEKDSIFGDLRNHSSETISLSETIINYTQDLQSLDFSGCPNDFKVAFNKHIEAWLDITAVSDKYPTMRGELHDIFKELEKGKDSAVLKRLVVRIWDTWELVEQSAN